MPQFPDITHEALPKGVTHTPPGGVVGPCPFCGSSDVAVKRNEWNPPGLIPPPIAVGGPSHCDHENAHVACKSCGSRGPDVFSCQIPVDFPPIPRSMDGYTVYNTANTDAIRARLDAVDKVLAEAVRQWNVVSNDATLMAMRRGPDSVKEAECFYADVHLQKSESSK